MTDFHALVTKHHALVTKFNPHASLAVPSRMYVMYSRECVASAEDHFLCRRSSGQEAVVV